MSRREVVFQSRLFDALKSFLRKYGGAHGVVLNVLEPNSFSFRRILSNYRQGWKGGKGLWIMQ